LRCRLRPRAKLARHLRSRLRRRGRQPVAPEPQHEEGKDRHDVAVGVLRVGPLLRQPDQGRPVAPQQAGSEHQDSGPGPPPATRGNPKSEARNPKQIRNPKHEGPKPAGAEVSDIVFRVCLGFRISCFGFPCHGPPYLAESPPDGAHSVPVGCSSMSTRHARQ
jgi:hypothetical protein